MNKVLFSINTCTQTQSEPFVLQTLTVQACPYSLMWFSCESVQHVVITTACVHMFASFFPLHLCQTQKTDVKIPFVPTSVTDQTKDVEGSFVSEAL